MLCRSHRNTWISRPGPAPIFIFVIARSDSDEAIQRGLPAIASPLDCFACARNDEFSRSRDAFFVRTRGVSMALSRTTPRSRPSSDVPGVDRPDHHDRTRRKTGCKSFFWTRFRQQKEAERRQTRVSLLHLAAKRAPWPGRARLSAFHGGSAQGTHASPGAASDQASRSQHHDGGGLPPAPAPVAASTSHTGHSAGRHDVRYRPSAEATKLPLAGTAISLPPAIVTG